MTGNEGTALGIYVSIPFCRSKCTYCNFASGVYPAADHERYVRRVIEDLASARAWAAKLGAELPRRVDTVYLGGGTPTLLAPDLLARLFAAMRAEFDVDADAEITVECAPGQLADAMLEAMAAAGVNRVSLGVQSFVDSEAHASGRLHSRAIIEEDLRRLRAAGITNLNVDLIAGLAGQTLASWEGSLQALVGSGVPHASIYMLEVDEDSRLGREVLKGGSRYHAGLVPREDTIAQMYECAIERLEEARLRQYEISNFSRFGLASRHNLRYWQRRPYLGVGLDASSMLRAAGSGSGRDFTGCGKTPARRSPVSGHDFTSYGVAPARRGFVSGHDFSRADGEAQCVRALAPAAGLVLRSSTTDDLNAYLSSPAAPEITWLAPARQHEEAWFLGLRLNAGVDVAALKQELGSQMVAPAMETAGRLVDDGLLTFDGKRVQLTARGRLISNEVFQQFLEPEVVETRQGA
jgi:oxygen-independent coproporphyrinogen-3 oxidase